MSYRITIKRPGRTECYSLVLDTCNDAFVLDTDDRLGGGNTSEEWIGAEAFPVTSSSSLDRQQSRSEKGA